MKDSSPYNPKPMRARRGGEMKPSGNVMKRQRKDWLQSAAYNRIFNTTQSKSSAS